MTHTETSSKNTPTNTSDEDHIRTDQDDSNTETNNRFEGEESAVLPSLSQARAPLVGNSVQDAMPQPVDGESPRTTFFTQAIDPRNQTIIYRNSSNATTHQPDSNSNGKGSVNPRHNLTPTLTEDVPLDSDEPSAAVGVGGLPSPQASTSYKHAATTLLSKDFSTPANLDQGQSNHNSPNTNQQNAPQQLPMTHTEINSKNTPTDTTDEDHIHTDQDDIITETNNRFEDRNSNGTGSVNLRHNLTLTLTEDVPLNSDEPSAAVGVGGLPSPQASTSYKYFARTLLSKDFSIPANLNQGQSNHNSPNTSQPNAPQQLPMTHTEINSKNTQTVTTDKDHIRTDQDDSITKTNNRFEYRNSNGTRSVNLRHNLTPTPTEDVPLDSDEPSAAVGVGGLPPPQASTSHKYVARTPLSKDFSSSTNLDEGQSHRKTSNTSQQNATLFVTTNNERDRRNHHNYTNPIPAEDVPRTSDKPSAAARGVGLPSPQSQPTYEQTLALQWNLNGIQGRYAELEMLTTKYLPVVIALQETRLTKPEILNRFHKAEYKWSFCSVPTSRTQNGVGLAVHNSVEHKFLKLNSSLQAVAAQVIQPVSATFVSIYIPCPMPPNEFEEKMQNLIEELPTPFILLGDFNCHSHMWGGNKRDTKGAILEQFIIEQNLILLNSGEHTRLDPRTGLTSALDLTISSPEIVHKLQWKVCNDTHTSDHYPIILSANKRTPSLRRRKMWKHENANWNEYEDSILELIPREASLSVEDFSERIIIAAESSIPRTTGNVRKRTTPWWNDEVKAAVKLRRKKLRALRKLGKKDLRGMEHLKETALKEFQKARSESKKIVQNAKKKSWEAFVGSFNPQTSSNEMWKKVGALCGKTYVRSYALKVNDVIVEEPNHVAEHLAEYFEGISAPIQHPPSVDPSPVEINSERIDDSINEDFTLQELFWALDKGGSKSVGNDEISYPMLRHLPFRTKVQLLETINTVWRSGVIPASWKEGITIPIPKPGNNAADRLAKDGRNGVLLTSDVPGDDAIRVSKTSIRMSWEIEWQKSECFLLTTKSTTFPWSDRLLATEQRALTRLRIGHTRITHQHLFNRESNMCDTCGVTLSIRHILIECRKYEDQRSNCNLKYNIDEILTNDRVEEKKLIKFISETGLINVI
ncbi:uncharacterized protein LOC134226547 [Armigeres subalbatus]|uniref:uncharacterized protein LOC134226547 n=1 Tax=Armigeres subalbatus TaxID=124917 RepID=UPI002ED2E15C